MDAREALIESLLRDLASTPASSRGALVKAAADKAACSVDTIYRLLRASGWTSGRKPRQDRGTSRVSHEALRDASILLATGRNARGNPNIPLTQAQRILAEQGNAVGDVSRAHLSRLLNANGLGLRHMTAPTPAIQRQSQHPNHVWLVDYSPAIQWYFRDEQGRKRLELHRDGGQRFASKPANVRALRRILHRFAVVDHYSGALFVRYYYTSGERAEDVMDFLARAMGEKAAVGRGRFPFRGVPRRIVFDQGSANKSAIVLNALASLGVKVEHHAPGNAKASGAIEKVHQLWQSQFEARMAVEPAEDLDVLNDQAERFAAHLNATAEHSRTRTTRSGLWSTITADQLCEAPPRATIIALATTRPREATLTAQLWLRHGGAVWHIAGANVFPGQRVSFRLTPLQAPGITVEDEHGRSLAATPVRFDARSGFVAEGAPRHVWDDADHAGASVPMPPAQHIGAAVAANDLRAPVRSAFDVPDAHLETVAFRPVQGRVWEPPAEAVPVAPVLLSPLEAKLLVAERVGRPLGADAAAWSAAIGDGITEEALEALLAESPDMLCEVG